MVLASLLALLIMAPERISQFTVQIIISTLVSLGVLNMMMYLLGQTPKPASKTDDAIVTVDGNVQLYPRTGDDPVHPKNAQRWISELMQYDFVPAGEYVVYEQQFGYMTRKKAIVDGLVSPRNNIYAAIHSSGTFPSRLEIFTPYRDGSSFTCDNGQSDLGIFACRHPQQPLVSGMGLGVMEMIDRAAKNRPEGEVETVTPEGFRDCFLRLELGYRTWYREYGQRIARIDLELREELYHNAGRLLPNPGLIAQHPEAFIVVHDDLTKWALYYASLPMGLFGVFHQHRHDEEWLRMTPRELFRGIVEGKMAPQLRHVATLESPRAADVYLNTQM